MQRQVYWQTVSGVSGADAPSHNIDARLSHFVMSRTNADMGVTEICDFCTADSAGQSLLRAAMNQFNLSARAFHRVLTLARMIADLAESSAIQAVHIAEAIQHRPRRQISSSKKGPPA